MELIVLTVNDLSRGGSGVARDENGRVVFIPFSAPGDRVRVRIKETEKRYAQAEIVEILEPSPLRQTPRCPAFGECGGCQWQHIPYSLQWDTKVKGVLHALERVQVALPLEIHKIPAENAWEYRNRVQLRGFGEKLGYYASGTHRLVAVNRCDIARPEINQVWNETRLEGARLKKPYKVEIEVLPDGQVRKLWNARHAAAGFRQVYDQQNEKMVKWVSDHLNSRSIVLDLFGGSGNFSRTLAEDRREVHCVDVSSPNSRPAGFSENVFFHRTSVLEWLRRRAPFSGGPIGGVIDPPRMGLNRDLPEIGQILEEMGVTELIAIGCSPDEWARDVSGWVRRGWVLEKVMMIDLFPQTSHVESVARLIRGTSDSPLT